MKNKGPIGVTTIWDATVSGDIIVVKPADTTENVSAGGTPSAKTFSSFTGDTSAIASYQSVIVKPTGSLAASGSGLGAYTYSGHADGEGYTHLLHAKDASGNILATAVHSIRIAPAASSGGWVTKSTHDFVNATNSGPHTSGTHTIDCPADDVDVTPKRASGNNGTFEVTNAGAVVTAIGGSGAMTGSFNLGAALAGYDFAYIRFYAIAVDVYLTNITFDDDGSICQIGISDSTTWSDGDERGLQLWSANSTVDEQRRIRGAGSTTTIDTRTKVTERVVTLVMTRGQIVDFADTSGTSAPGNPHSASPLYTAGGDAVGRNNNTPLYLSNFFLNVTAFGGAALTCTKIVVRRFQ